MKKLKVNGILAILTVLIASCTTQRKFNRIADKHEDWLLTRCIKDYPNKETTIIGKTDTIVTEKLRVDTVTTTVVNTVTGKTQVVKLPCPPCKSKETTLYRTDTVKVRDTRVERQLQLIIQQKDAKYAEMKEAKDRAEALAKAYKSDRNWAYGILGVLLLAFGALKFLRVI